MYHCRLPEQILNKCVFDNLGLEKKIPGAPTNETPIHERRKMIFGNGPEAHRGGEGIVERYREKMRVRDEREAELKAQGKGQRGAMI